MQDTRPGSVSAGSGTLLGQHGLAVWFEEGGRDRDVGLAPARDPVDHFLGHGLPLRGQDRAHHLTERRCTRMAFPRSHSILAFKRVTSSSNCSSFSPVIRCEGNDSSGMRGTVGPVHHILLEGRCFLSRHAGEDSNKDFLIIINVDLATAHTFQATSSQHASAYSGRCQSLSKFALCGNAVARKH